MKPISSASITPEPAMNTPMALCFYPRPRERESIGSVILRASTLHHLSPRQLLPRLGGKWQSFGVLARSAITTNGQSISHFALMDQWQSPPLQNALCADAKRAVPWLRFHTASVCPQCAAQGFLPHHHDFSFAKVCATHRCELLSHCPSCEKPLHWNRKYLGACPSCEQHLIKSPAANETELEEARILNAWIDAADRVRIEAYLELKGMLVERYCGISFTPTQLRCLLTGDFNGFNPVSAEMVNRLPELTVRAVFAPLQTADSSMLRECAQGLVRQSESRPKRKGSILDNFYLTHREVECALGLIRKNRCRLQDLCLDVTGSGSETRVPYTTLANFFSQLRQRNRNSEKGEDIQTLAESLKLPIPDLIAKIFSDEITLTLFDESADIGHLRVTVDKHLRSRVPQGHLNLAQSAAFLNTYATAIIELHKNGFLRGYKDPKANNQYRFLQADLEAFAKDYIFGGDIARTTGTSPLVMSEKLISYGITPVSGPSIDRGALYIFRRSDLENVDLVKISQMSVYTSLSGRTRKSLIEPDESELVTSAETVNKLGISAQELHRLVDMGLLVEGTPHNASSTRRRYFKGDSVDAAHNYLSGLINAQDFAREFDTTVRNVCLRMRDLLNRDPVMITGVRRIDAQAAAILRPHLESYWDAAQFAKYLGVEKYAIHNHVRLGKLSTIKLGEPGYIPSIRLFMAESIQTARAIQRSQY